MGTFSLDVRRVYRAQPRTDPVDSCPSVPLLANLGLLLWDSRPEGEVLEEAPLSRRAELRIPLQMFVSLHSLDNPDFEFARTIDISCHGARVVTKKTWEPNQQLSIRSMRCNLRSLARVTHCLPYSDNFFVIGIQTYARGDWTKGGK